MSRNTISDETLRKFVLQVEVLQSVNFPDIARTQKLNWFKDIKPRLKDTPWFLEAMREALETIKYELVNRLMIPAKGGKDRYAASPEISYAKVIINMIDDGSLLGLTDSEVENPDKLTGEQLAAHLKRLGFVETKEKKDEKVE